MDEHIVLDARVASKRVRGGDLVDDNLNDHKLDWIEKHNRYATRHMVDHVNREIRTVSLKMRGWDDTASARAPQAVPQKFRIWHASPLYRASHTCFFCTAMS